MMDVFLARQPIFDLKNQTYGYELLFRNNRVQNSYGGIDGDESTAHVLTNSFFDLQTNSILAGKKAFVNFTYNLIVRGIPKLLPVETLIVEVLEDMEIDDELLDSIRELKKLGYIIALDDFAFKEQYKQLFDLGDIVKIDFRMSESSIEETSYMCRYAGKIMLAEKVETIKEVEYAISLGCTYMQGYYFAKPVILTRKTMNPMQKTFFQLISMLNSPEVKIEDIAEMIAIDASIVVRLLKLVNSAFYSNKNRISNIHQALVMIGIEPLKDWIYLIGLKEFSPYGNEELLKLAFLRARFCEEISLNLPESISVYKEMYLMGLISLMHVFFGISLKEMLSELPVSQVIKDGIMGTGGIFSEVYKLCYAYERAAWTMVDKTIKSLGLSSALVGNCYLTCINTVQEFWDMM